MLLSSRKFLPFFLTQALGAFNDNLVKQLLIVLFTYEASRFHTSLDVGTVSNVAAGLFIVPFALFSGLGGHWADNMEKAKLIQALKFFELLVMILAGIGLMNSNFWLLMSCIFLMGVQAALFGPVKYALLPSALNKEELMKGNALVESATFLVILLGTLCAGFLAHYSDYPILLIGIPVCLSLIGLISSFFIPACPSFGHQTMKFNIFWSSTIDAFHHARQSRVVWLSVMGISWFWFVGALALAQLPVLAPHYLGLNSSGLTWLLAIFSVGVGFGSILCEKIAGQYIEIGLVPLGSIGLSLFLLLAFSHLPLDEAVTHTGSFLDNGSAIAFGVYLGLAGLFGGLYIVPLYALIQTRSNREHVAGVISANNILNAAFMVASALLGLLIATLNIPTPWLILFAGLFNLLVAIWIYTLVPEFLWRFIVWILVHTVYQFKVKGLNHIPEQGACIVVCNHVGLSDAVILAAAIRRPLRFIMYYKIFQSRALGWFFKTAKAIPIAGKNENSEIFESAFLHIQQALNAGEVVCLFPEGKLTSDGEVDVFRPGLLKILEKNQVPVIPMALGGLWGSIFSRHPHDRKARWGRPIDLTIGQAIDPQHVEMADLRKRVIALRTRP